MKKNKAFVKLLSPTSQLILMLGFSPIILVVFRPTVWEFLVFVVVDSLALALTRIPDRPLFRAIFPEMRIFFPEFDLDACRHYSVEQKSQLFHSLVRFPQRRALFCLIFSYVKTLPALTIVVLYWKHSISNELQTARALAVFSLMFFYFYGCMYFELHQRVSNVLVKLHEEQDWTDVFRQVASPFPTKTFDISQYIAVAAIWAFMAVGQALLLFGAATSPLRTATEIVVVSFGGLVLFTRLWFLERNYFVGGLLKLFVTLEKFTPSTVQKNLPLHSSPFLAQFERTFNALMDRLRSNERELSHWIFTGSEQSRFRALGETSGLIVHDLSTPLQVIAFCAGQLIEDPRRISNPRYLDQMKQNTERALELIDSWRAYLRHQTTGSPNANLKEALEHVCKLLATQIEPHLYNSVKIVMDPQMADVNVAIPRAEMIHILINLLSNSFRNLIKHSIHAGQVSVQVVHRSPETVTIAVHDNGTGMKPEAFERLTAFDFLPQDDRRRGGMGLRLVRRLIEQNEGQLNAVDNEIGTELRLTLKTATVQSCNWE
jgi:signal transduction histidine kinase